MKTLISMVFRGDVTKIAAYRLSPDRLILFDCKDHEHQKVSKKAIQDLKDAFSKLPVKIEVKYTKMYDIVQIAHDVIKCIDEEHSKGSEIHLHISEGRKTHYLGFLMAAYSRKGKVAGAYYLVQEENGRVLKLPLLSLKPSKAKQAILKEISKGNKNVISMTKKLKKTKGIIYIHIRELREDGFIEKDELELTEVGKISIL
ncbi:MAG: DUF6293 family protein [Candidatus Woesearchaeota archaeon]